LADKALLDAWGIMSDRLDQAQQALMIAREVGDPALTAAHWPHAAASPHTTPRRRRPISLKRATSRAKSETSGG